MKHFVSVRLIKTCTRIGSVMHNTGGFGVGGSVMKH